MTFKNAILVAVSLSMASPAAGRDDSPKPEWVEPAPDAVSAYVRRIFQDSKGNFWFGTNGDGVARYNGDTLEYFSIDKGFGGEAVRGIVEDDQGNIWFGTSGGLTKFDGKSFTNLTVMDGPTKSDVWCLMIDSKRMMWIGTWIGISRYDGKSFTSFSLPVSHVGDTGLIQSLPRVMCIMEDSEGRMWFGTEGTGAYVYDGKTFRQFTDKDGLSDNNVSCILEDRRGAFWFSTMFGGVNTFDGKTFKNVTEKVHPAGLEVWNLYEDKEGNIWFPGEGYGLYRYDGKSLANFYRKQGLDSRAIQCSFQDRAGRLWAGGYLGLYRLDGETFVKVGRNGPWD